jgi:hypothetical protein
LRATVAAYTHHQATEGNFKRISVGWVLLSLLCWNGQKGKEFCLSSEQLKMIDGMENE